MTTEREYQELYDRLLDEVRTLHKNNRRRIRNGMRPAPWWADRRC